MAGIVYPDQIRAHDHLKSCGRCGCFGHMVGLAVSFGIIRWFQLALSAPDHAVRWGSVTLLVNQNFFQ